MNFFHAAKGTPARHMPFLRRPIPLWVAFLVFLATGILVLVATVTTYQPATYYQITLPEERPPLRVLTYGSWPALANQNFFNEVKSRFVASGADFIEADLSTMALRVYIGGKAVKEAQILSKGKEGSWWETPAGVYAVEGKKKNHFSSFGRVYLPWSLPFQGNFFIHGWPYYPDGTDVGPGYSGGCIRLSTADAKEVFDLARIGMPVLVFEEDFAADGFTFTPRVPDVSAASYLVADLKSGSALVGKETAAAFPIASLTKLMTAIVATEYISIEKEIVIPAEALVSTSRPRLKAGQAVSLFDLLHILLAESSNEAAQAIARFLGPVRFADLLNQKARAIGMTATTFADASGMSAENVSSAEDLFALAKYLYNNRGFILKISAGTLKDSVYGTTVFGDLRNFNAFVGAADFLGGKVGTSNAAHETLMALFETPIGGVRRPIVVIVLGSDDGEADAEKILSWVRTMYSTP